ncbi:MAG: magnesium transporter [Pseudomonadales bacterium]|nr:magnesium transporter [Pseudomonadales bacterium]
MSSHPLIATEYLRRHPGAAAHVLDGLPAAELDACLDSLPGRELAHVLEYMSPAAASRIFAALDAPACRDLLEYASSKVAIALLSNLDAQARTSLLDSLNPAMRDEFIRLLAYPTGTAGRLMDSFVLGFRPELSVAECLDRLRESGIRSARSLYVVSEDNRLLGRISMQDLALAERDERIRDLMQPAQGRVGALDGREEVVEVLDRFRLDSVPVVDENDRLVGVVRHDSLLQAVEHVASADLQKMVGVSADERALSPISFSIRRRLPWLHINLLTAFLAAAVVGMFESLIGQFTALAVLLPVVAGQSGNAGSQSLAVTIRGLALKEVGIREWRRLLSKELMVGAANGVALAITCGVGVLIWSDSIGLALVIGVAMIMSMIAAGIAGALVPIGLTRLGQDPATASSIILTTVTDVTGFLSFLGTASLLAFML